MDCRHTIDGNVIGSPYASCVGKTTTIVIVVVVFFLLDADRLLRTLSRTRMPQISPVRTEKDFKNPHLPRNPRTKNIEASLE
jgi:hypothetical protein